MGGLIATAIIGATVVATTGVVAGAAVVGSSRNRSSATINNNISSMVNVLNSATSSCTLNSNQIASITVGNITNSNVNINTTSSQSNWVNSTCVQNSSSNTDVLNSVNEQAQQNAQAISQEFQLGGTASQAVYNTNTQLSTAVTNAYTNNCSVTANQVYTVTTGDITGSVVSINDDITQYQNSMLNCVLNDTSVTQLSSQMEQQINQEATSHVQNFFAVILGVIFAIVAIIAIVFLLIVLIKGLTSKKTPQPQPGEEGFDDYDEGLNQDEGIDQDTSQDQGDEGANNLQSETTSGVDKSSKLSDSSSFVSRDKDAKAPGNISNPVIIPRTSGNESALKIPGGSKASGILRDTNNNNISNFSIRSMPKLNSDNISQYFRDVSRQKIFD